jgi:hypothetical protein
MPLWLILLAGGAGCLTRGALWVASHKMRGVTMIIHRFGYCAVVAMLTLNEPTLAAAACSDVQSTLIAAALRPVLQRAEVCAGLTHQVNTGLFGTVTLGVDKTDTVEMRNLQYCPTEPASSLEASVFVRCKTSDAAVVRFSLEETFDVHMRVDNTTCNILDMNVVPHGDIGRLVSALTGFSEQIKQAAAQHIRSLCR